MANFIVEFDFTMVQTCVVEAKTKKEAIELVKSGNFDVDQCDSNTKQGTRRNWRAEQE